MLLQIPRLAEVETHYAYVLLPAAPHSHFLFEELVVVFELLHFVLLLLPLDEY